MTRGNWQRRVELNEARRSEAKQRKQATAEKKIYKQKAQKLLDALEHNKDALQMDKPWEIHIWCDLMPSDAEALVVDGVWDETDPKASKRRNRSSSIESENSAKSGRPRAGNESGGKKKHPRSKEKEKHPRSKETVETASQEQAFVPRLCRSHFFSGEYKNRKTGKSKGDSAIAHYPKNSKTLAAILKANPDTKASAKKILAMSESAHPDSPTDENDAITDSHSMEMVYYIPIPVRSFQTADRETNSISESIAQILIKKACTIGSIVYLAFNGTLLYDRYREGLLLTSDNDLRACLSMGKNVSITSSNSSELVRLLPGQILEYTLTFLSEHEVAAMSSVCKPWHNEIGKDSANLWRHFSQQRGWPFTPLDQVDCTMSYRKTFLSHYSAVRDVNALESGIIDVLAKRPTKEAFSKSFDSDKDAPQCPNHCAGVKIWSPNQILSAYSYECKLRLFTTAERSNTDGGKVCRELVCRNIDPYKNTKRKLCRLVDLALDETQIACLGRVAEEHTEKEGTLFLLLAREDFLVSDEIETLQVIDVRQAILNFLLDFDGVDDDQLDFISFLSGGGELDELEVLVSQSMVACGKGLYMIHASWQYPNDDDDSDNDDSDDENAAVPPKLFLFSSGTGSIVLMCNVNSEVGLYERRALVSSVTGYGRSSFKCMFAATTPASRSLMIGTIDSNGAIHTSTAIEGAPLEEGFTVCVDMKRPIAIVGSQIIVADALVQERENPTQYFKSTITFYSEYADTENTFDTLELDNFEVTNLVAFREEHVLALCKLHNQSDPTDADEIDGDWFRPVVDRSDLLSLYAIIFHVPTRKEIHRVCLVKNFEMFPLTIAVDEGTVAAGLWWRGMVMTGEEVRHINHEGSQARHQCPPPSGKTKKKNKKAPKKGGKKDGFARGMSLRG